MNQENQAASEGWPEDKADWPHAVGVVQGGVSPIASVVVNDRESADFACVLAGGLHALQKHCDGFAEQAAFQRDARLGALKELAKVEGQRDMLLDVLRKTADDLAYVAYNIDGSKLDDLAAGLSESTCPSETALIAERNCREAISRVKGSEK